MKKLIALLLAAVMVFALAACGQQAAPAPAAPAADKPAEAAPAEAAPAEAGEIVINFPSIWVGTDSKAEYMAKLVEDFNAENAGKIKVVVEEQTDYQAYRDKIRTLVTTGNAPDLCILDTTFDVNEFTKSGKFMDFAPYLAEGWGADFSDGSAEAWSVDGMSCMLPMEAAVFTPIYNTKIFEEVGWDHFPVNYDEFFQFCKDCKAKGYNAMGQMAGENAWTSMLWYSELAAAIGGPEVYADGLDNPAFVQAAELLKEMYNYTFDGAVSAGAADVNGHWTGRDTAIYLNGPWWIANLYKEDYAVDGELLADICEVAEAPCYGDGKAPLITAVQGFIAAGKQSDPAKEAAVVKFVKYITDPQHVSELSLSSGAMFLIKYTPAEETKPIAQKVTAVSNNAAFSVQHVQSQFGNDFMTEFPAAVQALIAGTVDAEGFVERLQTAMELGA